MNNFSVGNQVNLEELDGQAQLDKEVLQESLEILDQAENGVYPVHLDRMDSAAHLVLLVVLDPQANVESVVNEAPQENKDVQVHFKTIY